MLGENGHIISTTLDQNAIKSELAEKGFIVIPNFLDENAAERIFNCLNDEVRWELAYREGNQSVAQTYDQQLALTPEERAQQRQQILDQAKKDYQFSYFRYPMIDAYMNNWKPKLILNDVLESFNSPLSLDFLRDISGDHEVRKVEFQATNYAPGHFLKLHNDMAKAGDDRRYACVVGLTKEWQSDWGGLLQFVDDNKVTRSFTPSFNSCAIFKVPRDHQVSYVAPYASKPRYSLTGWLRAD
jgi:SM-20-related protein